MYQFSSSYPATRPIPARRLRALTSIASCLFMTSMLAQPLMAAEATDKLADEIVVTAKGGQSLQDVLATSHILTREQIDAAQARDITELLDQISSIVVTDSGGRGSDTGVFLRGASRGQTIVLIDGVRVGSATLGLAALNTYPIEAIERIEVVKGPLSGIYGADAIGGVIQLFTRKQADGNGQLSATFGSDSLQQYGLSLHGGNDRYSYFLSANTEQSDGIDRTSITSGGNDDLDGYEEDAFSLGAQASITDNTVASLSLLYSENKVEFDNTFGDDTGFFSDGESLSLALGSITRLNSNLVWNNILGFNRDELETPAFFSEFVTDRDQYSSELVFALAGEHTLTVGADYYSEDISTLSDFPVNSRNNTGLFAQLQTGTEDFGVVANMRYDDNSAYGDEFNGSVAVSYALSEAVRLTASYGSAFVAPSFNDLYFPFFGNPDLLPEESESLEIGLRGTHGQLSWRLTAYRTDVENLFSFDPASFTAANIGSAELNGVEFELGTRVYAWDVQLAADILDAEDVNTGIALDDRAERSLTVQASRQWEKLDLRFALRAESGRTDLRGEELSGFGLFDIGARYAISPAWSLDAKVENLLDKDYTVNLISTVDRYQTEGRQARLTLRYGF